MSPRRSRHDQEQDDIVDRLTASFYDDSLDEDEYDALKEQLDVDHQFVLREAATDFADDAVGSPSWRSDQ